MRSFETVLFAFILMVIVVSPGYGYHLYPIFPGPEMYACGSSKREIVSIDDRDLIKTTYIYDSSKLKKRIWAAANASDLYKIFTLNSVTMPDFLFVQYELSQEALDLVRQDSTKKKVSARGNGTTKNKLSEEEFNKELKAAYPQAYEFLRNMPNDCIRVADESELLDFKEIEDYVIFLEGQ